MWTWLAAAAALPLVAPLTAHAKVNGAQPPAAGNPSAAPNLRLPAIPQFTSQSLLQDGMIAQEEVAPNAHVGVGLAPMRGRNIHSVTIQQELVPTRNPGVTFVVKLPG